MEREPRSQASRRDILRLLGAGAVAGPVLRAIPVQAAEYAHRVVAEEKSAATGGAYSPKFFPARQYQALNVLCEAILPADADCGGAVEGGAPEFIDLLASENPAYQLQLGGGLMWLDNACATGYGAAFLECAAQQQAEVLDRIAYRKNAVEDPNLLAAVEFFALLRNLTADAFFTSKIGIQYLGYVGNTFLPEFPGCPPVPGV